MKINKDRELRDFNSKFEIRELGEGEDKKIHIQGYALTFGTISEDLGGFKETISRGALDDCDLSDVVLDFNHDFNKILARNNITDGIGSLKLEVDKKGLFFDAIPTNTSYSNDVIENIRSGILNKCSFIFRLDWSDSTSQTWEWDDGKKGYDFRTIHKIKSISDVSVVVFPAYNSTETTTYSRAKKTFTNEDDDLEIRKKQIEIELELGDSVLNEINKRIGDING